MIAEDLPIWMQKVHMHKANYHTLNMCTVDTNGFLAAECWIPSTERGRVYSALQDGLVSQWQSIKDRFYLPIYSIFFPCPFSRKTAAPT